MDPEQPDYPQTVLNRVIRANLLELSLTAVEGAVLDRDYPTLNKLLDHQIGKAVPKERNEGVAVEVRVMMSAEPFPPPFAPTPQVLELSESPTESSLQTIDQPQAVQVIETRPGAPPIIRGAVAVSVKAGM